MRKRRRALQLSRDPQARGWRHVHYSDSAVTARNAVERVLRSRNWKSGYYGSRLIASISEHVGVPESWIVLTNSCTTALQVAYNFMELDEWRFPIMTYAATYAWPQTKGYDVELVDCDDDGWPVAPVTCGVELWGRPYPHEPPLVLDAAHVFAGPHHAMMANGGTAIAYSFGPMKEVACFGGGALVWKELEDPHLRKDVEAWLHYGQVDRIPTGDGGINGYMNHVEAGMIQRHMTLHLSRKRRRQLMLKTYHNFLGEYMATKPDEASGHIAVVKFPNRGWLNRTRFRLDAAKVEHGIHYPVADKDTHAWDLSMRIMTLPCHTKMHTVHIARICRMVLAG